MFECLKYTDNEEKINFEKYVKIRGKFVLKQIYDFLLNFNKEKVEYADLSTCIIYDKNLRDNLYIYLATFEEYLRSQIFDKYEINEDFNFDSKEKNYIEKMAENIYESNNKEYSVLYANFSLDLGKTITLIKCLKMFGEEKLEEFEAIRVLRNRVMHHNLIVLANGKSLDSVANNKEKIKRGIVALSKNLPDGYGQNFIKIINSLRCDFPQYKITIEA